MAEVAKQAEVDPLKPRIKINLVKYPAPYNPYPANYNARVHGPYDPARYYGKSQIQSAWDVKLGDIPRKLVTSERSALHLFNIVTRWFSRYNVRHFRAKNTPINFGFQVVAFGMFLTIMSSYGPTGGLSCQRRYRYHW